MPQTSGEQGLSAPQGASLLRCYIPRVYTGWYISRVYTGWYIPRVYIGCYIPRRHIGCYIPREAYRKVYP